MPKTFKKITSTRITAFLFAILTICSLAACRELREESTTTPTQNEQPTIAPINPNSGISDNSYAETVARVSPAVVTVRSERRARAPQQFPFMNDPRFREFFGNRLPQQAPARPQRGLGSGVIVTQDGYILTNHHVIDGAEDIRVETIDNQILQAKIVGSDPPSDLAVLKVEAESLPVLPIGNSDNVRVGDIVLAVGNPLGVGQTVTSGIISAKGRTTTGLSNGSFEDFLQTDAPINQGNSGGALVNTQGELIGINSQILSPSGGNIGIGFAIPTNMARNVMEQLIKTGTVRRGQLGVNAQPITAGIAASLGLPQARGVIISQVQPDSAAARAGLRAGDVVTALNNEPVEDSNNFRNRIASTPPGGEVTLTIIRDGREQQIRATLGELASANPATPGAPGGESGNEGAGGQLGIGAQPLTPELRSQLGLSADAQGVVVTEVDPTGPASDAGIEPGDVIEQVNRQPVRSVADVRNALQRSGDRPVLLLVNRRGSSLFLTVQPRR